MPQGEGAWPVSWALSSSRAARPPGMRPLAATVRRRPAGGCGPAPASGIQPSGIHPQPGPPWARARVRPRRPAPSLRVPRSRAGSYIGGPCASRGAQAGGVRPPAASRCRGGGVHPYAVPRRTRRRAGAVRGAAVLAGWGRRRAGTACACCARYSTSWSPASSSGRAPLTRCCVGRGGGVMRCAGWPGASARGAPAPAAPDRRRVGRRPRAVPAR